MSSAVGIGVALTGSVRDIASRDEMLAYPYRCVGAVRTMPKGESYNDADSQLAGSGALVGRYHMLTATHLFKTRPLTDWDYYFLPAYHEAAGGPRWDTGLEPYSMLTGRMVAADRRQGNLGLIDVIGGSPPVFEALMDIVSGFDFVICELARPLGDDWEWIGVMWGDGEKFYTDRKWITVGYPISTQDGRAPSRVRNMTIDEADKDDFNSREIETERRLTDGWSGGPLIGQRDGDWWVAGALSGHDADGFDDFDGVYVFAGGPRLGEVHQQALSAWVKYDWVRVAESMAASFGYTPAKGAPSVCSWGEGRLDVFWRSADNHVRHAWYPSDGGWSWEEDLTAMNSYSTARGTPAALGFEPGRLDVLWRSPDNHLRHAWYPSDDAWSWEEDLTAMHGYSTMGSEPTVCSWEPGRLDVFWRDEDAHVKHIWYPSDGNWSWEEDLTVMGSYSTASSTPAAVAFEPGRLDVFWRAHDGHLKHIWYPSDDSWSWEEDLTAMGQYSTLHTGASVCSWEPGRLDVFWRDTQDHIKHIWYPSDGNWSWEEDLNDLHAAWPEATGGSPAATAWAPGRLDLFWPIRSGGLWHAWHGPDA